jgi:hypothetical protein
LPHQHIFYKVQYLDLTEENDMQTINHADPRKGAKSFIGKRALMVLAAMLLALTVNTTAVEKADSQILKGALIGGGVGAIFGGSRGAVAGVIVGGVLGGMSKGKRKKRRW